MAGKVQRVSVHYESPAHRYAFKFLDLAASIASYDREEDGHYAWFSRGIGSLREKVTNNKRLFLGDRQALLEEIDAFLREPEMVKWAAKPEVYGGGINSPKGRLGMIICSLAEVHSRRAALAVGYL